MMPIWVFELCFFSACMLFCVVALGEFFITVCTLVCVYIGIRYLRVYTKKNLSIEGKSVLVTGCDTGFGHGLALRLHEKGFRVFAGCLFSEGEGAKTLLEKCPNHLFVVPLDVTKEASVKEAEKIVRENLGNTQLWGLVNNAGLMTVGEVELIGVDTFKRVYDVNVFGVLRVTKAFLPLIRKPKGRVVMVSSVSAQASMPSNSVYCSSKAALESIGDCLRMEMRKFGVGVYIVEPGGFAGNTSIASGDNAKRLTAASDREWNNLGEDVKAAYGEDYLKQRVMANLKAAENSTSTSMDPVLDAIQNALISTQPPVRNFIHGGRLFVDPLVVFATLSPYVPTLILDWLYCRLVYGSGKKQKDTKS